MASSVSYLVSLMALIIIAWGLFFSFWFYYSNQPGHHQHHHHQHQQSPPSPPSPPSLSKINHFAPLPSSPMHHRAKVTIFFGGPIITMDPSQPQAAYLVVQGDKILQVGRPDEFSSSNPMLWSKFLIHKYQPLYRVSWINLQGQTLMPGFINSHTHILFSALVTTMTDISSLKYPSLSQTLGLLQEVIVHQKSLAPVLAFGYDPSLFTNSSWSSSSAWSSSSSPELNREILDQISDAVPIVVFHLSGHIAYANSPALTLCQITVDTPSPAGGRIEKKNNSQGQSTLTGRIYEIPGLMLLLSTFMTLPPYRDLNIPSLIQKTLKKYARLGYTTLTDLALGLPGLSRWEKIMAQLSHTPVRLQGYVVYNPKNLSSTFSSPSKIKILGQKIWADGSIQAGTAAIHLNSSKGLNYPVSNLQKMVLSIHQSRQQVAVHANGDAAVAETLQAFEYAQKLFPRPDARFRIEHATILNPTLISRMAAIGATPSFTGAHIYYWEEVFKKILTPEQWQWIDAMKSCLKKHIIFTINDDSPLASLSPFKLMEIAVKRSVKSDDDHGRLNTLSQVGPQPREAITPLQALQAMTVNAGWQTFRDHELGMIKPGFYADFVVLKQNPIDYLSFGVGTSDHWVSGTWVGGKRITSY